MQKSLDECTLDSTNFQRIYKAFIFVSMEHHQEIRTHTFNAALTYIPFIFMQFEISGRLEDSEILQMQILVNKIMPSYIGLKPALTWFAEKIDIVNNSSASLLTGSLYRQEQHLLTKRNGRKWAKGMFSRRAADVLDKSLVFHRRTSGRLFSTLFDGGNFCWNVHQISNHCIYIAWLSKANRSRLFRRENQQFILV